VAAAPQIRARLRRQLRRDPGPLSAAARHADRDRQCQIQSRTTDRRSAAPARALLRAHRAEQAQERSAAAELWHDEGWVFATETGEPIHLRTDYSEWKRLLKAAGLRDARLHHARHTAATVLLVLRQPTPTVMSLMGWSSESMAARYRHGTDSLRSQVASQVGQSIWSAEAAGTQDLVTPEIRAADSPPQNSK
jgi:integrase